MVYKRGSKTQHKFKKANKTKPTDKPKKSKIYKGVKYKSNLEVFAAKAFDEAGLEFVYEKYKYVLQEKFTCDNFIVDHKESKDKLTGKKNKSYEEIGQNVMAITYTPDFVNHNYRVIVETKGFKKADFVLKYKMFKKYMLDNGMDYDYYMPSTNAEVLKTIEIIKSRL